MFYSNTLPIRSTHTHTQCFIFSFINLIIIIGWKNWKKAFYFVACPIIVLGHVNAFILAGHPVRPEFKEYDHMRIRTKVKTLFRLSSYFCHCEIYLFQILKTPCRTIYERNPLLLCNGNREKSKGYFNIIYQTRIPKSILPNHSLTMGWERDLVRAPQG